MKKQKSKACKQLYIEGPPFNTHCSECGAEYINHQAPMKPPGVIGYRECNCIWLCEEIKPSFTEYYSVPFKILQHYECVVLSVEEKTFWAKLIDKTKDLPDEQGEFLLEKVPLEERCYIKPGAVFDWYIGDGKFKIRFRKAIWTKEQLDKAHKRAAKLYKIFNE